MKKLLLVLFVTIFPVLVHGATYYVATTGNDSTSCPNAQSQSTPKLTINAGAGCLSAGDTLIVKAGTYVERISGIPAGLNTNTPTILQSEVQYGAIVKPGATAQICGRGIFCLGTSNVTIDGFVSDATDVPGGDYHMGIGNNLSNITVQNNEIRFGADNNSTSNTVGVVDGHGNNFITIRNNIIHDMGTGDVTGNSFFSYGMYLHVNNSIIEGNKVYNCSGYGMHFYNTVDGDGNGNIIRNNYIHDNGNPVLFATGGSNNQFYNNLIINNGGHPGIDIGYYSSVTTQTNLIANNTLYGNRGACMRLGGASHSTTVRNNICYMNSGGDIIVDVGIGSVIDHNLLGTNPLFVSAAAADFHLQAGSPAIDAGVVMPNLSYKGPAPDLGALESGTSGALPVPSRLRLVGN